MRRADRAVGEIEAWEFVCKGEYGVLSLSDGKIPYGVPLNYCLIDKDIYFHCAHEGRKIDIMKNNPLVSFCVVKSARILPDKFSTAYESVIVEGVVCEVAEKEKRDALVGLIKKYSYDYYENGLKYIESMLEQTSVFKITVKNISGKSRR
ncbi:MAG: uncharacterized protein PWQ25_1755 [Deferribacteres bacterium]|jgi:hypothetical protein|nr:uncharacterized protein [Deferribacteres bacterium]